MTDGRVLILVEQLRRRIPGGIGRYAAGLIRGMQALSDEGLSDEGLSGEGLSGEGVSGEGVSGEGVGGHWEVSLFASRTPGRGRADPLARFGLPVRTSRLPGHLMTRAWGIGLDPPPADFDVVHAVSLLTPPPGRRRGRPEDGSRGPALVVAIHDVAWRRFPEATTARGRRWHEAALGRALRRAAAVMVPSDEVAEQLGGGAPKGGLPPVTVVPWGADHLPPPDPAAAKALLAAHGVEGGYVLTASTLEPRKNLRRLVAAYRQAAASFPERWPLVLVGPPGWGDGAVEEAGRSAPGEVVAVGPVGDGALSGLYAGARVFAYVPLTEGYGFPPVEAMVAGVPVVASTGVPSVPADPAAGLRVDPFDVEAMAEALVRAATDEALRTEMVERGKAVVATRGWRDIAARHRDVWESVR